jgi:hypothetical protein
MSYEKFSNITENNLKKKKKAVYNWPLIQDLPARREGFRFNN